jgi:glycosyltransferase involved in cell wall biosynthesis
VQDDARAYLLPQMAQIRKATDETDFTDEEVAEENTESSGSRMRDITATLGSWARTWRAEGVAAVGDRLHDRWREARERGWSPRDSSRAWPWAPILNVLGVPLVARGGGVPLQLRARLRREREQRPVALLSRRADGGLRVDCWSQGQRRSADHDGGAWSGNPLDDEPGWLDIVRAATARVGARAVHIENLAGLSLSSLQRLGDLGLPVVVSMHDFAAFCRRPHLWQATGGFCHYSTDADRCGRCLTAAAATAALRVDQAPIDQTPTDQRLHRALAAQVLAAAAAIVLPSAFLRASLSRLTPWPADIDCEVIAPGLEYAAAPERAARRADQVAFVGGGADHKGGARLSRLARTIVARGAAVTVYGGNGHDHLQALRREPGVRVRGYYRAGSLPALLSRQQASVALLLPGVPESFSLALSDAWAAGIPVVAPAQGALRERLEQGGGVLLSADPDDEEVVDALDRARGASPGVMPLPPTAQAAAARHLALYRRRGWLSER